MTRRREFLIKKASDTGSAAQNLNLQHTMKPTLLKTTLLALSLTGLAALPARADIGYQFVPVGDPGNAADTNTGAAYGSVSYNYNIGKYEVTLTQYTAFLNAVAAADPYGLYNPSMGTDMNSAGISRSGSDGSYTYSVIGSGNRPVTYVSMLDAMRMANWMQNGQLNGLGEVAATTETGAYTMSLGGLAPRNAGATVFVPSENEWYKAAYYDPTIAGANKYWLYATRTDTVPGNTIGGTANQANYKNGVYSVTQSASYSSTQNYLTPVGSYSGSGSYYGTYDQDGNVWEWNDTVIGSDRGLRGGSWDPDGAPFLQSSGRLSSVPAGEGNTAGFRLASVAPAIIVGGSEILLAVEYRFNTTNGVSYRIEASPDLLSWTTIETPIIGNGTVNVRFYSIQGQQKQFYRTVQN